LHDVEVGERGGGKGREAGGEHKHSATHEILLCCRYESAHDDAGSPRERIENAVSELDDEELDFMIEALRERALAVRQEQSLELKAQPKALPNGRH